MFSDLEFKTVLETETGNINVISCNMFCMVPILRSVQSETCRVNVFSTRKHVFTLSACAYSAKVFLLCVLLAQNNVSSVLDTNALLTFLTAVSKYLSFSSIPMPYLSSLTDS